MKQLKIPYGISNYEKIATENYYFVDKTQYIERLEETGAPYLFFLRPRRFGKSLFVSMLEHYYDIARKEQFEQLFGNTYIGKNPTALRNSYPILKFNFSMVSTHGTFEEIMHSFWLYVVGQFENFVHKYQKQFNIDLNVINKLKKASNTGAAFTLFNLEMRMKNVSLYLIIDEYDNFISNILSEHDHDTYIKATHACGVLRSFFAILKGMTDNNQIERMFITGVSPLIVSDATSGFNIGEDISLSRTSAGLVGLNPKELKEIINYYLPNLFDTVYPVLSDWYGNYCFDQLIKENHLFNTTSILYFIQQYLSLKELPSNLVTPDIGMDYDKLRYLVLEQQQLNDKVKLLAELAEKKETTGHLAKNFALDELISKEKFQSLLFYLGFTTIKDVDITGWFTFSIPNKLVDSLLWEYIRKALNETYSLNIDTNFVNNAFHDMAKIGEWKPIIEFIITKFYEAVSVRDFVFHEEGLKTFMLAWLNLTNLYDVISEKESNKGFADITMTSDRRFVEYVKYDYAFELKYLKAEDVSTDKKAETAIEKAKTEAETQLKQYTSDKRFETKRIVVITSAKKLLLLDEIS